MMSSTSSTTESELLEVVRPRYLKANKLEKQKILDELASAAGYHRKYAIRVLKSQVQNHLKGKGITAVKRGGLSWVQKLSTNLRKSARIGFRFA
ncbi:MAG: hypothetical protein Q7T89_00425 [Anaerolineales bacterium]|nr:hypothetical protein [Anaerolineales bacterium]